MSLERSFSAPLSESPSQSGRPDLHADDKNTHASPLKAFQPSDTPKSSRNANPALHRTRAVESPFKRPATLLAPFAPGAQSPDQSSPEVGSSNGTPSPLGLRRKDLPPALSSLDLRLQGPFHGSTTLPAVEAMELRAPATVYGKGVRNRSFEAAKIQVDKDLRSFARDATSLLKAENAFGISPEANVIESLLEMVNHCLEEDLMTFKGTIQTVVDTLEVMRRRCNMPAHKALVTRLLFILTRCSRLVVTEESNSPHNSNTMYGTLPRGAMGDRWRRISGLPPFSSRKTGGVQKQTSSPRSPVLRSFTMPSKAIRDMVAGFQHLKVQQGRERLQPLCPLTESPLTPTKSASSGDLESAFMGSPVGHMGAFNLHHSTRRSPLGRNVVTALEAELDQAALSQPTPASSSLRLPPETNKGFTTPPSTPKTGLRSGGKRDRGLGLVAGFKRLQKRFSKTRQHPIEHSARFLLEEDASSASEQQSSPASPATPTASIDAPSTSLRLQHSNLYHHGPRLRAVSVPSPVEGPHAQTAQLQQAGPRLAPDTPPSDSSAMTVSPKRTIVDQRSLHASAEREEVASSPEGWPRSPVRGVKGSLSMQSPRGMKHVICRICEEQVVLELMDEHSRLCSCLDEAVGEDLGVDAFLTRLANFVEQYAENSLSSRGITEGALPDDIDDMDTIISCSRAAAALQPDSTTDPAQKCQEVLSQVEGLLDRNGLSYSQLLVDVELFARRAQRSITAKLDELYSFLPRKRVTDDSCLDPSETTPLNAASSSHSFGSMDIQDFKLLKPISRGSFGRVYLCEKKATKDYYAIKVMRKADLIRKNMVKSVRNERNILAITNNPFVVSFYYSFTNDRNLYIVMEYCNGGDCYNLLKSLGCMDEDVARLYIAETILALEYCHTKGIIHRDLKPDNLLISGDGHIKLTDFGLSTIGLVDSSTHMDGGGATPMETDSNQSTPRSFSTSTASSPRRWSAQQSQVDLRPHSADSRHTMKRMQRSNTALNRPIGNSLESLGGDRLVISKEEAQRAVGTPDYLAPELLLGTGHGPEVDWWSLGAILYEFVTGVPPFNAATPQAIFENILNRNIEWPEDPEFALSPECRDLIDKLLNPDPEKRLGHRGAGELKLHPFFQAQPAKGKKGINWKELVSQKAAFVPSSASKLSPSLYFEEKPISKRSMELDTQSDKDDLSRRGTAAMPSPAGSVQSRRSRGRPSRRAMHFPLDDAVDRLASRTSGASSFSHPSGQMTRPGSAEQQLHSSTDFASSMAAEPSIAEEGTIEHRSIASGSGSSTDSLGVSPSRRGEDTETLAETLDGSANNQFMNWSYKNVELLGERNREMAEQFAELRSEHSAKRTS